MSVITESKAREAGPGNQQAHPPRQPRQLFHQNSDTGNTGQQICRQRNHRDPTCNLAVPDIMKARSKVLRHCRTFRAAKVSSEYQGTEYIAACADGIEKHQ